MQRIRGFMNLVFDVVDETTSLVERTHDEVVERSVRRFAPIEPAKSTAKVVTGAQSLIAGTVFKSIHGINGLVRFSVNGVSDVAELALKQSPVSKFELVTPMQSSAAGSASWCVDYLQASVNGLWGDYLHQRKNDLDAGMSLRHQGRNLAITKEALAAVWPEASSKVCVFVHGLASTEWLWHLSSAQHYEGDTGVSFGSRLQADLGYTPVYVRYNTGLHISENGKQLSQLLSALAKVYLRPIEEICLVGHSMGGLVVRSAAHYAHQHHAAWLPKLKQIACIGAPNLGAPMEKAINLLTGILGKVDAAGAQVPAIVLNSRSAGVKDLRYGYTVEEEWSGKDPDKVFADARKIVPLVDGVGYYFFAATITKDPLHPVGRLLGDLLVRVPSASGQAKSATRSIHFTSGKVFPGMDHGHIINHPEIYRVLKDVLSQPASTLALT